MAKKGDKVETPFGYLIEDHQKVAKLFKELEGEESEEKRTEIFQEIKEALTLHAEVEEKAIYPLLEKFGQTHDLTMESEQEHHVIKLLLRELDEMKTRGEEWMAKAKVLQENVEHHVEEEEKADGLFKKAEQELSEEQTEEMKKEMRTFLNQ